MPWAARVRTVAAIDDRYRSSYTPGRGSTAAQMTPTRTTLKPLAARNAASASPNPPADGSYGGTL